MSNLSSLRQLAEEAATDSENVALMLIDPEKTLAILDVIDAARAYTLARGAADYAAGIGTGTPARIKATAAEAAETYDGLLEVLARLDRFGRENE